MSTEAEHGIGEAVAARIERRWATLSIVIVGVLVGMATYIGIHQATMPQGHVETADPKTLHLSGEFVESNLGSSIEGTNINTMLVPGYVSELPVRFKAPGDHVMPCQEFCGIGHQGMWGNVKVVDKTAFLNLMAAKRRLTCVD